MKSLDHHQIMALANQVVGTGEGNLLCCNLDGTVRFANSSCCDRLGYSLQDMLDKKVYDFSPRSNPENYENHCRRTVENGSDRIYSYHEDCGGAVYPVEIYSIPHTIESSQEQLICSLVRDARNCERYMRMLETVENSQHLGSFDYNLQDQSLLASDNLLAIMGTDDPHDLRPASLAERLTAKEATRWNAQMLGFMNGFHRMDEQFMFRTADDRRSLLRVVMWSTLSRGKVNGITGYYEVLDEPISEQFISLEEAQRRHIERALSHTNGRVTGANGAGELLGINGKTLFARMRRLGINRQDYVFRTRK